ncbi:recombinase family protein [Pseudomonas sp. MS19]|uniref:recombinase family protein n=1 Tax=Pseudomonas sp. MS19 TaxID=2579939 RepID=UPI001561CA7E|nr:recombinase family protein [Pseudomonas sp. MS19]NRH26580.1 recombinase family protein [Pseudomonas sp. MS19]
MAQVAYVRVSSADQCIDRQLVGLTFDKTFTDKVSGGTTNRPQLQAMLEYTREGDTITVHSIDRLARSLADLLALVEQLTAKGVTIHFHKENLTFTGQDNGMQKLMLQMMGSFAEFERSMIKERQAEGIAAAKLKGKHLGRPVKVIDKATYEALKTENLPAVEIAKRLGVSKASLYRWLSDPR